MAGLKNTFKFFGDVKRELKKVSWPTRDELWRYTVTVIATVAFFAIFFALVDFGLTELVKVMTK